MKKQKKVTTHRTPKHSLKIQSATRKRKSSSAPAVIAIPIVKVSTDSLKLPRKRRTKNVTRMYFTQETEDAIVLYNQTEDLAIREQIFRDKILQPFQKLVENVLNTFKFSYFETGPQDVQKECLTHLVANMHKFDPNRMSRNDPTKKAHAFAYFSIIAKHYLILLNNTNYKKFNQNVEISEDREKNENTVQLQRDDKYYAQGELNDFIKLIIDFWEKNVFKIFPKKRDLDIANAVIHIMQTGQSVALFNKKALYLYIRDITNCRTQQITKVINKMKPIYNKIRTSYTIDGKLPDDIFESRHIT